MEWIDTGSFQQTPNGLTVSSSIFTATPSSEPGVWDLTTTEDKVSPYHSPDSLIDRVYISNGASSIDGIADEIRVGTTFASVLPGTGPAPDPFDAWASDRGLTGVKTDDADIDGVNDYQEYALNGNPTNASDRGTFSSNTDEAGFFTYIYVERTDDTNIVYSLVETEDLVSGTSNTNAWDSQTPSDDGVPNFETITTKYDMTGNPEMFINLMVE